MSEIFFIQQNILSGVIFRTLTLTGIKTVLLRKHRVILVTRKLLLIYSYLEECSI
jgi:hypothetical protein